MERKKVGVKKLGMKKENQKKVGIQKSTVKKWVKKIRKAKSGGKKNVGEI